MVVRYFGWTLLSFFPCSFHCPAAHTVARDSYRLLADASHDWADKFLDRQNTNILYTEYQGIYAFKCPVENNMMRYQADQVLSTQQTPAAALIRRGNRMEILNPQCVMIMRDSDRVGIIEGSDVLICLFHQTGIRR